MKKLILLSKSSTHRIDSLDLLRGFAVLGILIMNITSFSQVNIAYMNPTIGAGLEGYNQYFHAFNYIFADTRFMSIFSILFGAGVVLFTNNAEAKGKRVGALHYKRMFWLLLFGLLHAYFIWEGDILVAYAICGCLIYLLRKKTIRALLIMSIILFIVPLTFNLMTYYGMTVEELESTFAFFYPSSEEIAREVKIMQGSFLEQMPIRLENAIEFQTLVFMIETFWRTTSLMLLGMILYRKGILSANKSISYYSKMILVGFGIGLIISLIGLNQSYDSGWPGPYVMSIGANYKLISGVFIAIGYIGFVMWCFKKGVFKKLQNRLQAAGRMAFTNYIGMSVICSLIFNGNGLALYGTLDRLQQFLVVVAIWVLILIVSPLVLRKYRYGPLEWLWRKLTYFF
ncbi:MAG: hypothetical protein CMC28_03725 [Flavobacteriaceae bacterium]|nr:hypothetical protein [Flavobacteriaceae bacterium]|tara:strand:+ start:2364 stop:3560 length:1197 start_codon:yes stop_codon:yes gene_type:complete